MVAQGIVAVNADCAGCGYALRSHHIHGIVGLVVVSFLHVDGARVTALSHVGVLLGARVSRIFGLLGVVLRLEKAVLDLAEVEGSLHLLLGANVLLIDVDGSSRLLLRGLECRLSLIFLL